MNSPDSLSLRRPRALLLALALLALVLVARFVFRENVSILGPAELKAFNDSAGQVLGRHLASRFPGASVLLVVRPGAENGKGTAEEEALLAGFKNAVAGQMRIAGIVAPQAPDWFREEMRQKFASGEFLERDTALLLAATSMWYETRGLADLIRAQPEPVSLVVSTAVLPYDFPGSPALAASLPPVALLLSPVLDVDRMLESGRVEAMVVFKPPQYWKPVDSPGADTGKAFDSRYVLVHSGNLDAMRRLYPEAFR